MRSALFWVIEEEEKTMMMMLTPLFTLFLQISAINVTYIFILCRSEHMNNMF